MNESPFAPDPTPSVFERRLTIATLSLLGVALLFHLLRELAAVFQPLFIAALITYMAVPAHRRLVQLGVPSRFAHFVLIGLVLLFFFLVGRLAESNYEDLLAQRATYEKQINDLINDAADTLHVPELKAASLSDRIPKMTVEQLLDRVRTTLGGFANFLVVFFTVVLYLVFLTAEIHSFPKRAKEAFGADRAGQVLSVIDAINRAIGGYLGVLSLINALIGLLTFVVLAVFGVPFAPLWALLMFLFAYIPYIGSVVVTLAVLVMTLVKYTHKPWLVVLIGVLLIGIQQFFGSYLQPKLMGNRLGVSPLLILIALGFWFAVWGIIGVLLAVPLLMVLKITLENIPETKPLATLMSNP